MCWNAASSIWYWKRVSLFSATGPSGATPSSGGIDASVVVVAIVIAVEIPDEVADEEAAAAAAAADDDSGSEDDDAETIEAAAFTVDVLLLPAAGREPPLPMPAVDAARGEESVRLVLGAGIGQVA